MMAPIDRDLLTLLNAALTYVAFPDYTFEAVGSGDNGGARLRAYYYEPDVDKRDGPNERQNTRWWVVSRHAVLSEIVQTMFICVLTSHEHRVREHFTYRGRPIFGPHFDVDALHSICDRREMRL